MNPAHGRCGGRSPRSSAYAACGAARLQLEAAVTGAARVRAKMAQAVQLAALHGAAGVNRALGQAPRVAEPDLDAILAHQACAGAGETCRAGEQPILLCWARGFRSLAAYGSITLRCSPTPPAWAAIVQTTC